MKLSTLFLFLTVLLFGCSSDDGRPDNIPSTFTRLTVQDFSTEEGDNGEKNVFVRVLLAFSGELEGEVTATVSTVDGTAKAGEDYEAVTSQTLTFSSDVKTQEVKIVIKGDVENEPSETFTLKIDSATGATFEDGPGTITIQNDDGAGGDIFIPSTGYTTPETYAGMELIWSDEFSDDEVNKDFWTFEIGNGSGGWGNQESQYYREENTVIDNGHLVITASEENFNGFDYTSSRMITKGKFDFKYGRVDIRANLPKGQGIWPALWMLGSNISTVGWPRCGEIDIMEMVGHQAATTHGTIHYANSNNDHVFTGGETSLTSGILNDEFNVFSITWDETHITWYLNDVQYHQEQINISDRSELKEPQFFIFNVAVGGLWPGYPDATTTFPQRMIVDYIRVFQ
ncbi:MAG: family 16 glycosylhydrolase [Saprospiraceae bacterium]